MCRRWRTSRRWGVGGFWWCVGYQCVCLLVAVILVPKTLIFVAFWARLPHVYIDSNICRSNFLNINYDKKKKKKQPPTPLRAPFTPEMRSKLSNRPILSVIGAFFKLFKLFKAFTVFFPLFYSLFCVFLRFFITILPVFLFSSLTHSIIVFSVSFSCVFRKKLHVKCVKNTIFTCKMCQKHHCFM
jgi:hypothetical protein